MRDNPKKNRTKISWLNKDLLKNDKLKKIVVATVFTFVFIGSLLLMSFVFKPTNNYPDAGIIDWEAHAVYAEPKNTIDAMFIGNSEGAYAFTPMTIWNEQGFATYNCAGRGHPLNYSEDFLHGVFEKQSPKVVFLETDSIFKKSLFIWRIVSSYMVSTFSVLTYHNRWKGMDASEIGQPEKYEFLSYLKGFEFDAGVRPVDPVGHMAPTTSVRSMFYRNRSCLIKMKEFCEAHGAKLVLVSVPSTTNWNMKNHNGIEKFANEVGLEYIDMNLILDEVGIDWSTDTRDAGDHMNVKGAEKVSSYIGKYLASLGIFTDHRADSAYAQWNESLQKYNERKESEGVV